MNSAPSTVEDRNKDSISSRRPASSPHAVSRKWRRWPGSNSTTWLNSSSRRFQRSGLAGAAIIDQPKTLRVRQFAMQPGFGQPQFAMHGRGRNLQRRRGFVVGEAAEKQKLDNFALALVLRGQSLQGIV